MSRDALEATFKASIQSTLAALGPRPFNLRGRLNVAALDMTVGSVLATNTTDPDTVKACFSTLVADRKFLDNIYFNTSDVMVVKNRFQAFTGCLAPAD